MRHASVDLHLNAFPHPAAAEAAARRRIRGLEAAHPSVIDWSVRAAAPEAPADGDTRYEAFVQARIMGGAALRGEARGHDPLSALRLAFNMIEAELDAEQEEARSRASAWLATVRRRLGGDTTRPEAAPPGPGSPRGGRSRSGA